MKYSSKVAALCISVAFATGFAFADGDIPTVTEVSMQQGPGNRIVTIKYKLDSYPAVVTLDVKTNDTVSIGGEHIWNAEGAVWRKVTSADADGSGWCTITWDPTQSWKDGNGNGFKAQDVKAEVTAWPLDNTPDYMVVDIATGAGANSQKYYPSVDFLPGGILSNENYRTTKLVMRKIMAKGVEWTMGSTTLEKGRGIWDGDREATHQVALTNNYYIGVFPVTQSQWALVATNRPAPAAFVNAADRAMRPVENVSYNEIRNSSTREVNLTYCWPNDPNPSSFLGLLYTKTGIKFDLPSEAEWEFAARAGNGDTKWGNGSAIQNSDHDTNLDLFGRYKMNGGYVDGNTIPSYTCGATNGTAIVGSYLPNNWGLYDTAGNVAEWCLDWYELDISGYNGKVNIHPDNPALMLSGNAGVNRVLRSWCWDKSALYCRPAYRLDVGARAQNSFYGFRVVCTAGLQ